MFKSRKLELFLVGSAAQALTACQTLHSPGSAGDVGSAAPRGHWQAEWSDGDGPTFLVWRPAPRVLLADNDGDAQPDDGDCVCEFFPVDEGGYWTVEGQESGVSYLQWHQTSSGWRCTSRSGFGSCVQAQWAGG